MRNSINKGIQFNPKTKMYYVDTSAKLEDGSYCHICKKPKDDGWKNLKYAKMHYYEVVNSEIGRKNKIISAKNKTAAIKTPKINTVSQLLEDYFEYNTNRYQPASIKKYTNIVKSHVIPICNDDIKNFIKKDFIITYRKNVLAKNVTNKTKRSHFYILKELVAYLRILGIISIETREDFLEILKPDLKPDSEKERRNRYTSPEDAEKIINCTSEPFFKNLFTIYYSSSLRIGEFLGIKIKDIEESFDVDGELLFTIKITRQRLDNGTISNHLKNGISHREIYCFGKKAKVLKEYIRTSRLEQEDFLFDTSRTTVTRRFKKAQALAGVRKNTLHGFGRVSANMKLYLADVDPKTRSVYLGQKSTDVNERYYIENEESLKKAKAFIKKLEGEK